MGVQVARSIMQLLRAEVPKDLENFNVEHPGPEERYGAQTVTVRGPHSEIEVIRGHRYNSGWRAESEDLPSDEPVTGASTTNRLDMDVSNGQLDPCFCYAQMTLGGQLLVLNKITKDRFASILDTYVQDMADVRARERNREWWGKGTGELAVAQNEVAATGTTVRLRRDDQSANFRYAGSPGARFMYKDSTFVIIRNGVKVGTYGYIVTGNPRVQVADGYDEIDFSPGIEAGQKILPGDILVRGDTNGNSFNREPDGFGNIFQDGRVELNRLGISLTDFPEMGTLPEMYFEPTGAEGSASHYQYLTPGLMHRVLSLFDQVTGKTELIGCARREVLDELPWENELRNDQDPSQKSSLMGQANQGGGRGPGMFSGGVKTYKQFHPDVNVTWVPDKWAPFSELLLLTPRELEVHMFEKWHAEPGFLSLMPNGFYPSSNRDSYRARYRMALNVVHRRPFQSARIPRVRCQIDAWGVR